MGKYRAAISDLYRTHSEFHEERVLLPKSAESASAEQSNLEQLKALVPEDAGVYRAEAAPSVDHVVETIDARLLSRRISGYIDRSAAPPEVAAAAQAGAEDDLETRIDAPPATMPPSGAELASLRKLLEANQPDSMLVVEKSVSQPDGVFVGYRSAIVLASQRPWSASDVEAAINEALARNLTAGALGVGWKLSDNKQNLFVLDGVSPLAFAIDGRYCIIGDDGQIVTEMTQRAVAANATTLANGRDALVMLGGFNHEAERENFARATQLMDGTTANAKSDAADSQGQAPQFFSRDLASLSYAFQAMRSEEVSAWWKNGAMHQTVRYEWNTGSK
jgi:hypothetical protein